MSPRYATIDVGSNTMKLLIAEPDAHGSLERVYETAQPARLGRGIAERRLRESIVESALETLGRFVATCRANRVERIAAVGTSALRDAENRDEFVARARETGVPLQIISGDEEARLSYLAVRRDPHWRDFPNLLVIDIGGGSTEIIFGGPSRVQDRVSLSLGAVRLTEAALGSDPPSVREIAEASRLAEGGLAGLIPVGGEYKVVGVGGTLANMGRVALAIPVDEGPTERLHGARLSSFEVEAQIERFASCAVEQRRRILGLDPDRADVILGGAIILQRVMQRAAVDEVDVSTRGLRWGLMHDRFGS